MHSPPARHQLDAAFPADAALAAVLAALPRARIVGGAVRDRLAERPVGDIDLATPDPPDEVMAALRTAGLKAVPTGLAHGTVTAVSDHRGFEITTLRRDVATDGRHAVVAFTDDWREDAARRDFTINAMSMTPDGTLFDYFGGREDLAAGRVRFVGDPGARIAEDYLRILRFFRFHAGYGHGAADPAAVAAIAAAVDGLALLSVERVWSELKRILAAPDPVPTLTLMAELGVLAAVLPEAVDVARLAALVARGAPADPVLRLAALFGADEEGADEEGADEEGADEEGADEAGGDAEGLAARLRLSGAERGEMLALRAGAVPKDDDDDAALRRALAEAGAGVLIGRSWLSGRGDGLRARLAAIPRPVFPLHGRDLAGVAAGPAMGALLRDLRAWWLAGGCAADLAACRAELARRLARDTR